MSFRRQLSLSIAVLVVVPAVIAALAIGRVVKSNENAKADARLQAASRVSSVIEDALKSAVAEFVTIHPDAKPYSGPVVTMSGAPHKAAHLVFSGADGKPQHAYIGAAARGNWQLVIQVAGPTEPAGTESMIGELFLLNAAMMN